VNKLRTTGFLIDKKTKHKHRVLTEEKLDETGARLFFWGHLKDKVYSNNPRTEEELKVNIRREISNIPAVQLQKVNKKSLPLVRGMFACRGTAFSTPVICEQR
jgi:hypothetical protein